MAYCMTAMLEVYRGHSAWQVDEYASAVLSGGWAVRFRFRYRDAEYMRGLYQFGVRIVFIDRVAVLIGDFEDAPLPGCVFVPHSGYLSELPCSRELEAITV